MEVLQDTYKDTKIGRIPKDWEVTKLETISLKMDKLFYKNVGNGRLMVNVKIYILDHLKNSYEQE